MSTVVEHRAPALPTPSRWHRPLLGFALLMAALSVVTLTLAVVDPRAVMGQNAWFKPAKFALSFVLYAVTMAWLVGLPGLRRPRLAATAGTVVVVGLVLEILVIVYAAAAGTTSHFNVSTPLATALWSVMGVSIAVVWVMTLVVGVLVIRSPLPDRARALSIRAGVVLGLVGMALAFLMTSPTAQQLADFQGVAGAHAVGVADGGAGLPFLGWSTQGGDLRIGHFVGLHALQLLPLGALLLEVLAGRIGTLRDGGVRLRLVGVATAGYAGLVALLTVQALLGQPLLRPSTAVLATAGGLVLAVALGVGLSVRGGLTPPRTS
ncbi:hypothetical protein ACFFKU_01775 [Kineococcus gynurae]|uniref:Uncharacterized protein n=1 Tax=Kineococcus gynurae TaxID=452979 RepID=A0ABV5LSV7_9ACTN